MQKGQKGQHFLQTHTQTCREAPHMGFSSEAVASWTSVQWALPLIVAAKRSLYHVHYFCKGCADHFSNLIRRRHLPLAPQPMKVSHLRAGSRVGSLRRVAGTSACSVPSCVFHTFEVAQAKWKSSYDNPPREDGESTKQMLLPCSYEL